MDILFTLELDADQIMLLVVNDPDFAKQYSLFLNRLYRNIQTQPLDYVYGIPENCPIPEGLKQYPDIPGTLKRENILKNVVFKIILQKREQARKPKLSELLKIFAPPEGQQHSLSDKKKILEKLELLYKKKDNLCHLDDDPKFFKIQDIFDRISKVLRAEDFTIDKCDAKVTKLIQRKQDRLLGGFAYMQRLRELNKLKNLRKEKTRKIGK